MEETGVWWFGLNSGMVNAYKGGNPANMYIYIYFIVGGPMSIVMDNSSKDAQNKGIAITRQEPRGLESWLDGSLSFRINPVSQSIPRRWGALNKVKE